MQLISFDPSKRQAQPDQVPVRHVASAAALIPSYESVCSASSPAPRSGDVVLVQVQAVNPRYPWLENADGLEVALREGDLVVGALGARRALRGFSGRVPAGLKAGQELYLLNKGGVIGECTAFHRELEWPTRVRYIGTFSSGGRLVNLSDHSLPLIEDTLPKVPVIGVFGTCMNAGKTTVCASILSFLTERGFCVHAGKVAGVACRQDLIKMRQSGAQKVLSFHDLGLPSTAEIASLRPVARTIVHYLAEGSPDAIILEMGDGILGGYQVASLFEDVELMDLQACSVLCANDLLGVWGGLQWIRQSASHTSFLSYLISGPVTDSAEGVRYIEEEFQVTAANVFDSPGKIHKFLMQSMMPWFA